MTVHDKYTASAKHAYRGNITNLNDASNTDIKVALLDAGHSPNLTGHETWADVSADEIVNTAANSTGYTSPGQSIVNMTWNQNGRVMTFDGDNVVWSTSTIDAGYAVVYDATPANDSDKKLLTLVDFEGEESSSDGDFTIDWDTAGIFQIDTNPA